MKMRVRKVKRKCNVFGCKNTDCYALTKWSEFGNSVVACKNCLKEALEAIEEAEKATAKAENSIPKVAEPAAEPMVSDKPKEPSKINKSSKKGGRFK